MKVLAWLRVFAAADFTGIFGRFDCARELGASGRNLNYEKFARFRLWHPLFHTSTRRPLKRV